jgi:ABC-type branched-subunit amino acid transport system ATPase component
MLRVSKLTKYFGGLRVLSDVGFELKENSIKGLIGPNGAGKTTLFNLVSGLLPPDQGKIEFLDKDITGRKPEVVALSGISRTFQQPHLFKSFSVLENVMLGYHHRIKSGLFAHGLALPRAKRDEESVKNVSMEYLAMLGLKDKAHRTASELPLGEQRHLEVARALAMKPKLLLLDEPASGLNDKEVGTFKDALLAIRKAGVSLFVIEHRMKFLMDICDELLVLNFGIKIAEGTPKEIQHSPEVIEAYLGTEEDKCST